MYRNKLILAALSSTLIFGAAAGQVLPHRVTDRASMPAWAGPVRELPSAKSPMSAC